MSDAPDPKPWFRPKTLGPGWTPITWQGWLITLVFVLLVTLTAQMVMPQNLGLSARWTWLAAVRSGLHVPASGLGLTGAVVGLGVEIGVFLVIAWATSRRFRPLD